jgi:hypothetical protein
MNRCFGYLLLTTALLALLVSNMGRPSPPPHADIARLTNENAELLAKLRSYQTVTSVSAHEQESRSTMAVSAELTTELLDLHSHWDWQSIASEMLQPFRYIDMEMLNSGVSECFQNGTMYCARLQVYRNELYLTDYRAVFFDRHYAPARIYPMLDVLRRHNIPDIDIVVAAVDEPRVKASIDAQEWTKLTNKYPGATSGRVRLPPPLFSSTIDRAHFDLAWPDFSFYMPRKPHKLRTPPWCALPMPFSSHASLLRCRPK